MIEKLYSGINIQYPISQLILEGKKIIETRTYPIPDKYLDKKILLIETPGKSGKFKSRITGIIVFTECFKYKSKKDFYKDIGKHCVFENSPWAWNEEKGKWGWKVKVEKKFKKPIQLKIRPGIKFTTKIPLP